MGCKELKPLPPLSTKDIARFWSKVDKRGPDDCWPWTGFTNGGYGAMCVGGSKINPARQLRATRIAIFLHSGLDPFPLLACHTCDARYKTDDKSYRKCCNPNHLEIGTQSANLTHMADLGRSHHGDTHYFHVHPEERPRGETHGKALLTDGQTINIRARYAKGGVTQRALATEYGVGQQCISKIVRKLRWAHVA